MGIAFMSLVLQGRLCVGVDWQQQHRETVLFVVGKLSVGISWLPKVA